MATKSTVHYDEIGYWSEVKLDIIKKYASAYSTIMAKQSFVKRHVYIDAFAGAGTHVSKTTGEMVAGSPVNAMAIQPPFSELHLVDLDGGRTAELRRIAADDPRVHVHHGDCNEVLLRDVFPRCHRIDHLRDTGAHVKFLSIEPLLGPLPKLDLRKIDWVIVGGESGPRARPMNPSWVSDIRDQCHDAGVAFFFKQWGGVFKKKTGRELDGQTWDQMPDEPRTGWVLRPIEQRP